MRIVEAKNLDIYKKLLRILAEYAKTSPGTGVDRLFDLAVKGGIKIMPKDKLALSILDNILKENSVANSVQQLLNIRFSNCKMRPLVKNGRKQEVAFWTRNDFTSDKIKDLIDWNAEGTQAGWTDLEGNLVKLIDMNVENK